MSGQGTSSQPVQVMLFFLAGFAVVRLLKLIGIRTLAPVSPCLPLRGLDGSISRLGDGAQA